MDCQQYADGFMYCDKNGDKEMTHEELKECGVPEQYIDDAISYIDANGDHKIQRSEIID